MELLFDPPCRAVLVKTQLRHTVEITIEGALPLQLLAQVVQKRGCSHIDLHRSEAPLWFNNIVRNRLDER